MIRSKSEIIKDFEQIEIAYNGLEIRRLDLAFRKGNLLLELKMLTPHGEFVNLLRNISKSENPRKLQRFMRLAENENFIRNATDPSHLTVEEALKLIRREKDKCKNHCNESPTTFPIRLTRNFNAGKQEYIISVHIGAQHLCSKSGKIDHRALVKAMKTMLQNVSDHRSLADISGIVLN